MNFIEGDKDCLPKEKRVEANETCLEERDPVGATPLHLLCLFGHTSLAMEIISKYPERGLDMYDLKQSKQNDDNTENNKKPTLSPYHGENCLHIAIVKHDMELVKCSDYIIDLGPKGGKNGGKVLFSGEIKKYLNKKFPTANYLEKVYK